MKSFHFLQHVEPLVIVKKGSFVSYGKVLKKIQNLLVVKLSESHKFTDIDQIIISFKKEILDINLSKTDKSQAEVRNDLLEIRLDEKISENIDIFLCTDINVKVFEKKLPSCHDLSFEKSIEERIHWIQEYSGSDIDICRTHFFNEENLKGKIENFFGAIHIPLGVAGPLLLNGTYSNGYNPIVLATSEGALISSLSRGSYACNLSGGINVRVIDQNMTRSPVFFFNNFESASYFSLWIERNFNTIKNCAESESRYAILKNIKIYQTGKNVSLLFSYQTGESAGQNTTTFCTFNACEWIKSKIIENTDLDFDFYSIESNFSGDKKATSNNFNSVRGISVIADVDIPFSVFRRVLKVEPKKLLKTWHHAESSIFAIGGIGTSTNFANIIAGIFTATGQDIASVHESSQGIIKLEDNFNETINVSVFLPSLVIGTIGGGTELPTQSEVLKIMRITGEGSSLKLAEIIAGACLSLDISTMAAVVTNELATSHKKFGRKKIELPDFVSAVFLNNISRDSFEKVEIKYIKNNSNSFSKFWKIEAIFNKTLFLKTNEGKTWEYVEINKKIENEIIKDCFKVFFGNESEDVEKIYKLSFFTSNANAFADIEIIDTCNEFYLQVKPGAAIKVFYSDNFFTDNASHSRLLEFKINHSAEPVQKSVYTDSDVKKILDLILETAVSINPSFFDMKFTNLLKKVITNFNKILRRISEHPFSFSFNSVFDGFFVKEHLKGINVSDFSFFSMYYDIVLLSFIKNSGRADSIVEEIKNILNLSEKSYKDVEVIVADCLFIHFFCKHLILFVIKQEKDISFSENMKQCLNKFGEFYE